MDADARVRLIASEQLGHISGAQLRTSGLSTKQVHTRVRCGDLIRVLPGVFRLAGVPDTPDGRLTATSLWMGADGFFNGPSALYLLRLEGATPPEVVTVARYSGVTAPPWIRVTRLRRTEAPGRRSVQGMRICCVERALAESCALVPPKVVGRAVDDALRKRLTTLDRLWTFAETWEHRPGTRTFRTLLQGRDDRDEKVRSLFETRALRVLRRIDEYDFVPNYRVTPEGHRYFLDFYFPEPALGIECHSLRWHMGLHTRDARRDRQIRSLGIELLYFTWDDVCHHPEDMEHEIRAAIARRLSSVSAKIPRSGIPAETDE